MYVLATIKNNRLFRGLWWLSCLPLEVARLVVLTPMKLLYLITFRHLTAWWLVVWFILSMIFQGRQGIEGFNGLMFFGFMWFLAGNCFPAFFRALCWPLPAFWRLSPRRVVAHATKPQKKKEIIASIVMDCHASKKETRARMTARLSPELQRMVSGQA